MAMTNPNKISLSHVPAFVKELRSLGDKIEGIYNSEDPIETKQARISELIGDV